MVDMRKAAFLPLVLALYLTSTILVPHKPLTFAVSSNEPEKPLVIVLVNHTIYENIESSLLQYKTDLEMSGFSVNITQTNQLSNDTPTSIRSYLQQALPNGLVGGVLVGNVPSAWYVVGIVEFPTDLFYMDLDGFWMDSDDDGVYDRHIGNVAPEIWIGRIKPPITGEDEASLINDYFEKIHQYRTGFLKLPSWWRSLIYIDDPAIGRGGPAQEALSQVSTHVDLVTDPTTTSSADYKRRLRDLSGYQWLYLMSHGSSTSHNFLISGESGQLEWDTPITSSNYQSIDPRISFYLLFVCYAARYTDPDYLAGSIVFSSSSGLLVIGSTGLMFSLSYADFFNSLSTRESIGTAHLEMLKQQAQEYHLRLESHDYQMRYYGLTIIGDPTLVPYFELHDISITNVDVSFENINGEETMLVKVEIENEGDFDETFQLTLYYDSDTTLTTVPLFIAAGANLTKTFTFENASQLLFSTYRQHIISANVKIVPGEFDTHDNYELECFEGVVVKSQLPLQSTQILFALFVNVIAIAFAIILFKLLSIEKPQLFKAFRKKSSKSQEEDST